MIPNDELYQQMILDHNRHPHNFGKPAACTHCAEGDNPLCGDHYTVYLTLDDHDGTIQSLAFEGTGCAISKASASMMTDALTGKAPAEAEALFLAFQALVTGNPPISTTPIPAKLAAFSGIWKYPSRVKCAMLCWHALRAALRHTPVVTTETAEETPS